jgi:hypothetical protein
MSSIATPTSISNDSGNPNRIASSSTSTYKSSTTPTNKSKSAQDVTRRMICGGLAGMIAKTVTNPLERIKMLSQTGEYNVATSGVNGTSTANGGGFVSTMRNISQIYRSIIQNEGIIGLWAGNGVNLLRVFPNKAIIFSTNDIYKRYMHQLYFGSSPQSQQQVLPPIYSFLAGGFAGMTGTAVTYPLDLARGRIAGKVGLVSSAVASNTEAIVQTNPATATKTKVYSGMIQTILVTIKDEGFLALYKGITPTLVGAMPYVGIQFGTVSVLEKYFGRSAVGHDTKKQHDPLQKMLFGGVGGIMAGVITYPNDTIRRMLQLQGSRGTVVQYNGYFHCLATIVQQYGISRLYRGWTINIIRMAPNTAVTFGSYELLKHVTSRWST